MMELRFSINSKFMSLSTGTSPAVGFKARDGADGKEEEEGEAT